MQQDEGENLQPTKVLDFFNVDKMINLWPILATLETTVLFNIHMILAKRTETTCNDKIQEFIIVQRDGNVCTYTSNKKEYGMTKTFMLDFDSDSFDGRNIKTLIHGQTNDCTFAITNDGKVYSWGDNRKYMLGHEDSIVSTKPTGVINWCKVVDIACTKYCVFALTDDGKVYAWGTIYDRSNNIKIWKSPRRIKLDKKISSIACSLVCGIMITDDKEIYSWGSILEPKSFKKNSTYDNENHEDDDYCLTKIFFSKKIVKVVCGLNHALALTEEGNLYVWGENEFGQLGLDNRSHCIYDPVLMNTAEIGKLIDIAAVNTEYLSVAVNEFGQFYVWGMYKNFQISIPTAVVYTNMYEIFAPMKIMYQPLIISGEQGLTKNLISCLKNAFNDPSTSDFKIQIEEQEIHVHKAILNIRSSYFRNKFEHDWKNNTEISNPDGISYNIYKAYLKYLYTNLIDISSEEMIELLKLAIMYGETSLKINCISLIEEQISVSNVNFFYRKAKEYHEKKLEEFCFNMILEHIKEQIQNDNIALLNEDMKNFVAEEDMDISI